MNEYLIPDYFIEILFWTLIAELILVVFLLISIVFVKFWNVFNKTKDELARRSIAKMIMKYMQGADSLGNVLILSGETRRGLLLKELETFNQRFSGEEWEFVKEKIAQKYLLPKARNRINRRNWLKRAFAARCFALAPLYEDKDYILKLFEDPNFQVKSLVIPAIIHLKMKDGLIKILENMSHDFGYFRYYYLDTLVSAKSQEIFDWIEELCESNPNKKLQLACLEVLSGKMQTVSGAFLLRDIQSEDEEIRLAALKVFARNPQKNSLEVLLEHIDDPNAEIRGEAYSGLAHFRSARTLEALEKGLSDNNWSVRLQAATSLKNMGQAGMNVLKKQSLDMDPTAYEAAHFILQLDW